MIKRDCFQDGFFMRVVIIFVTVCMTFSCVGLKICGDRGIEKQRDTEVATKGIFLPNQWTLRPAGTSIPLGDFPMNMSLSPDKRYAAILHCGYGQHEVRILDIVERRETCREILERAWYGISFSPDGKILVVSMGADDALVKFNFSGGLLSHREILSLDSLKSNPDEFLYPSGVAIDKEGTQIYVAVQYGNLLVRIDLSDQAKPSFKTLIKFNKPYSYPYKVVLHPDGKRAYVSLWGVKAVAKVDLEKETTELIPTDSHPNEMILSEKGERLFVACANTNKVNIIDTTSDKVVERLDGALYPGMPAGSTPNALALSADEKNLYIANADNNNLAVFDVSKSGSAKACGFIPTGWYPIAIAMSGDKDILVVNAKGNGSLSNPKGPNPNLEGKKSEQYIGGLLLGNLSFISNPDEKTLEEYTGLAYQCSPLRADLLPVKRETGNPVPSRVGESSPIKYCVYIIKENRTYDQILGDMPEGNGDPSICLFGENVTPNHHAIAREFVLLDNFYVESEVSADGHAWSMGAYATDYVEKTWPSSYGGHTKDKIGYPSEGINPLGNPEVGHIWNRAKEAGVSYYSFGEWVSGPGPDGKYWANDPALVGHISLYYSSFNMQISDFDRVKVFMRELEEFKKEGTFPRLTIIRLPNDHTAGTAKGRKTPQAYVAENDQALGMILEALSRSQFWKEMAVFVVEDDAQNGPDHVDAHRTVAMAAGPYVKRGVVVHQMYSTASMLRTMELILGLQPMSQFDAAALPMYACFTSKPDFAPYQLKRERVSLTEINPENAPMQKESSMLNLEKEDSNPDVWFNEIIWKGVRGADSEMPAPIRAAFVRPEEE